MLALLDWGIGGADLFRRLRSQYPDEPMIYFSDSGFTPYGQVPKAALVTRLNAVLELLKNRGATRVVVACNAASTVLKQVDAQHRTDLVGVIEPTLAAFTSRPSRNFAVIGGVRTIRSGVYGRGLAAAGHTVRQRVAQPLSAMIEAGDLSSDRVEAEVSRILAPVLGADGLIMACTHYPALAPVFAGMMPRAELIDPASYTAAWVHKHWFGVAKRQDLMTTKSATKELVLTTGSVQSMKAAAKLAFGVVFEQIQHINELER